jgi:IS4 transposase
MSYEVTKVLPLPAGDKGTFKDSKTHEVYRVSEDCYFKFSSKSAFESCPIEFRRVTIRCDANGHEMSFITNNKELTSDVISQIYRERWQIESFFRTIKQNMHIKSFLGTSENAVNCQIWSAMTAIILIKYFQKISELKWNFSNFLTLIRSNLFSFRNIYTWINVPHCNKSGKVPPEDKKLEANESIF